MYSCTHRELGEPHAPKKPTCGGCHTAPGSSMLTASVGAMQKPTFWLRTARALAEFSRRYCANCWKCQWVWLGSESNPIVPARARPMMRPFRQKYWYALMIGEPFERKPCTSSGELPPTHTVAPKFRKS